MEFLSWEDWPELPEKQKNKRLPHDGGIDSLGVSVLTSKGWTPVDVRVMPSETDHDKAEQLKAWLEGVRLGTIEPDPKVLKFVELEAKTYGLLNSRGGPSDAKKASSKADKDALKEILNMGVKTSKHILEDSPRGTHDGSRGGRPKGSSTIKRIPKSKEE